MRRPTGKGHEGKQLFLAKQGGSANGRVFQEDNPELTSLSELCPARATPLVSRLEPLRVLYFKCHWLGIELSCLTVQAERFLAWTVKPKLGCLTVWHCQPKRRLLETIRNAEKNVHKGATLQKAKTTNSRRSTKGAKRRQKTNKQTEKEWRRERETYEFFRSFDFNGPQWGPLTI